ncbi:MAG TPA: glucose-6-phosphate isomerase [Chloroflexota bacterium]|nr:glucose-6-phosphate isomerase [Chloroflexota bacterium]HUM69032.1 glucose-6-phosphate isomerase [Chloroflexota bacterium]
METIQLISHLNAYETAVTQTLHQLEQDQIMRRIWQHDHTVWRPDPAEISNRLDWLHLPQTMQPEIEPINAFADSIQAAGFTHVLLLGMGGSSLAPELFAKTFGGSGLQLAVVDTTDPDAIRLLTQSVPLAKTLFIVATKSGGTVETLSAFKYFFNLLSDETTEPGRHFVAITDPGSSLQKLAARHNFRAIFLNEPNIGGRYSALSHFGLVPAAMVGVDIAQLLARAAAAAPAPEAARLGAIMGTLARHGRDKLTLITAPELASFGDWVEQLVAESTGKEGQGILPVVAEPLADTAVYGPDRLFVYLHHEPAQDVVAQLAALAQAGHPTVHIQLRDAYDLGGQFMWWELATAVAGHILNIQPFDQPNVESAKVLARRMVAAYHETGQLPAGDVAPLDATTLHHFLAQVQPGDYVALQAFVPPTPATDAALQALRQAIRDRYKVATTTGYGPRFLHSTGQLHKGDRGNGLFIQFTADPVQDVPIPDEAGQPAANMTFGILIKSQALGDGDALLAENRRFIRFHLGTAVAAGLRRLMG